MHDGVGGRVGRAGLVVAGESAGYLCQRRQRTACQYGCCNQAAHAEFSLGDEVDTVDDDADRGHVLQEYGDIDGARREKARLQAKPGDGAGDLFPAALGGALGTQALDGLDTGQGFNQGGLLLGGMPQQLRNVVGKQALNQHGGTK